MMDPSITSNNRIQLGDITNTITQGNQESHDRNARQRQRERERWASMSKEKKDERNRKRRERHAQRQGRANECAPIIKPEGDEADEWLHRGTLPQNPALPPCSYIAGDGVMSSGQETMFDFLGSPIRSYGSPMHQQDDNHNCPDDADESSEWLHTGHHICSDDGINVMIASPDGERSLSNCLNEGDEEGAICNVTGTGLAECGDNSLPAPKNDTQTQPFVVDDPYSVPPQGGVHMGAYVDMAKDDSCTYVESDGDENIVFEEADEEDEGYLFAGQVMMLRTVWMMISRWVVKNSENPMYQIHSVQFMLMSLMRRTC